MIGPEQHVVVIPAGWGFLHLHPSVCLGRHDYFPVCWSVRLWHQGDYCSLPVLTLTLVLDMLHKTSAICYCWISPQSEERVDEKQVSCPFWQ